MYTFLYDDNFSDWDLGQVLYHIKIVSHVYIIIRVVSMEILIIGVCWRSFLEEGRRAHPQFAV